MSPPRTLPRSTSTPPHPDDASNIDDKDSLRHHPSTSPETETSPVKQFVEKSPADNGNDHAGSDPAYNGPIGWRRIVILISLYAGLAVSMLDTTIVSISLPAVASHFGNFDRMTWVLTSYLLTHTAFSVITPKFASIFGRKWIFCAALVWFIGFSVGCALSRTARQLILFRALKGVGGGGLFSMCNLIGPTMVPQSERQVFAAFASVVIIASGMVGPVIGGAIVGSSMSTSWRYIFWLNVPIAGLSLLALLLLWTPRRLFDAEYTRQSLWSVDYLGQILFMGALVMLVFPLEEAGSHGYHWYSPVIICLLVFSAVCFAAFLAWQAAIVSHPNWLVETIFPVNVIRRRVIFCAVVATATSGFEYFIAIVHIPERFQLVAAYSPHRAGIGMLPLLGSAIVGSFISSAVSYKRDFTGMTLVAGSAFQLLGYGLVTSLGTSQIVPAKVYGFEVFLGLGLGLGITSASQILSLNVKAPWLIVSSAVLSQMRTLGGCVGLTNAVIILQKHIREDALVVEVLSVAQREAILQSPLITYSFPPPERAAVTTVFARAFTEEMQIAMYVAVAGFVVSLGTLWRPWWPRREGAKSVA